MSTRIKQIILLAVAVCIGYFTAHNHIIFFGREYVILKKVEPNFHNIIYNVGDQKEIRYKGLDTIIAIDDLRRAGIGPLLIERGLITQEELEAAEKKVDYGE
jgi:hypothetical protein